jgi:hypothetical protein
MSRNTYTKQDCIESLKEAKQKLGESPGLRQYDDLPSGPSSRSIKDKFGSWNNAKREAGLTVEEASVRKYEKGKPEILDYTKDEWEEFSAEKKRKYKRRAWVAEKKVSSGCQECGYNENPAGLTYHHLNPENKEMGVCRMASYGLNKEDIQKEIDKCIVLCCTCHQVLEHGGAFK